MFGVVSCNCVAARHPFRKWVSWCIQSMTFCHRNQFIIFRNEHVQSTTWGPKLMCWVVSHNFVVARHPFRKRVFGAFKAWVFANGIISSFFTTNMANPLLNVQNSCLGWFHAISLPHITHSENGYHGAFKAWVLPSEPYLYFLQRTCPIHYLMPKTHVWDGFAHFCCRTSYISKTGIMVHSKHEFLPMEPLFRFLQRTCPIHYLRPKTHVWGGFPQFRCCTSFIPKNRYQHSKHEFLAPEPFLRFSQRTCPNHYLRSKTHVWVVLLNFVAARHTFWKHVSWCIQSMGFCHQNYFFVFRNEHAQSTTWGPKLMFGVVSRNFIVTRHLVRKRVSLCIQSMSFFHRNHFFSFATNMPNPLPQAQNSCLGWFRAIWLSHVTYSKNGYHGAFKAWVFAAGTVSLFFATNMPNPLLEDQNSCLGWFRASLLPHVTHSKNGYHCAFKAWVFATRTIS
jgi:hypothetical protein